eukprot:scaffold83572_cov21-Tisochrysis_lutea.AAC.1
MPSERPSKRATATKAGVCVCVCVCARALQQAKVDAHEHAAGIVVDLVPGLYVYCFPCVPGFGVYCSACVLGLDVYCFPRAHLMSPLCLLLICAEST